ncbi:MAG: hypothetical protein QOJ22_746 [Thermoleophilaceae bacterium]|nr:hypothetical protein [Thermoleophilaceae bacterium]
MTTRTRLTCLAVLASLVSAVPAEARVTVGGARGTAPGEFLDPSSVAVTPEGQVLVGDGGNVRVQKLPTASAPLRTFGSYGSQPGQFGGSATYTPLWVAGGVNGQTYAGDPGTETVSRFDADGQFINRWQVSNTWSGSSTLGRPQAVETDESGDVYVATSSRITRYSADGTFEFEWTATDGQNRPIEVHDLSVRGGRAYVLAAYDWSYKTMAVYDPDDGLVLERWTTPASQLQRVSRIAADASGSVYAASWDRVDQFDTHGAVLGSFVCCDAYDPGDYPPPGGSVDGCTPAPGSSHSYPTEMSLSFADVAVTDAGVVYAADSSNDVVLRIEGTPHVRVQVGPTNPYPGRLTGQFIVFDASSSSTPFGSAPNRYEWDLDNDGDFELDTGTDATAWSAYATAGEHVIRVRATEPGGTSTTHYERFSLAESQAILYPARFATGRVSKVWPGNSDIPCSKVLKYEWDLDGDGTFEIDNGAQRELQTVFEKPGKQRVSLRVTRPGGRVDVATTEFQIDVGPPPGAVGVSINDGAQFTNTPEVTINPIWSPPTGQLFLANDGGFKQHSKYPVAAAIPWRLDSSGPERLPKTVYLRFDNLRDGAAHQDDIILDETAPVVTAVTPIAAPASVSARRKPSRRLRISAKDNVSGVSRMQLTASRKRPGKWGNFRRRATVRARGDIWVRVRDRAGNRSRWRHVHG